MLEENRFYVIERLDVENKTLSISKVTVITNNDIEIARALNTQGFVPGDIEKVKQYMGASEGPEIDYLQSIWTPEAIDNYQTAVKEAML